MEENISRLAGSYHGVRLEAHDLAAAAHRAGRPAAERTTLYEIRASYPVGTYALRTWIKPKMVIPMHYNSNPMTKGTLAEFQEAMKGSNIKIIPMAEGETVQL